MKKPETEGAAARRVLLWEGEPVLSFPPPKIDLPAGTPGRTAAYYRRLEQMWQARWAGALYRRACDAAAAARAASRPFTPWSAALLTEEAAVRDGKLCILWRAEERAGGRPAILRQGDVWRLPHGTPVRLKEYFPRRRGWKRQALAQLEAQIRLRQDSGEVCFWQDWPDRLRSRFDPSHFYQTEDGAVLFFPLCSIVPYFEGTLSFPLQIPPE